MPTESTNYVDRSRVTPDFLELKKWMKRTSKDPNYRGIMEELGGPGEDVMLAVVGTARPSASGASPQAAD